MSRRPPLSAVTALLALALLAGCSYRTPPADAPAPLTHRLKETERGEVDARSQLVRENYVAAEALIRNQRAGAEPLDGDRPLLVTTFVDLERLQESTPLGRLMAEHLTTRLSQLGYPVVNTKLRRTLQFKPGKGELMLSRELSQVAREHQVQAVVTGTFSSAKDRIFVSTRLTDPGSGAILSAYDYELQLPGFRAGGLFNEGENNRALMGGGESGGAWVVEGQ